MTHPTPDVVANGVVVLMHYKLSDEEGTIIDASEEGDPLPYLHGASNIVPGLEKHLAGLSVGDSAKVVVDPSEGYGFRESEAPTPVPREAFPDDVELEAGMTFFEEAEDGSTRPVWIADIDEEVVYIDYDHPLAGVTLHFEVAIVGLRAASEEEIAHGHPHGADGHHHHDHDEDEDGDYEE